MNVNTTNNKFKYWYFGAVFYVLVIFSGVITIANIFTTKAAPSSYFFHRDTITPTFTSTLTPTSTSTPTPTDTPTPTPTPTPTAPPTPTRSPQIVPTPTPVDDAVVEPTATPTSTATATSTTVAQIPPKTNDPFAEDTSHRHPLDLDSGSNTGGLNLFPLSVGIGTSTMLLLGGGLFWLYLRRNQQGMIALQKWHQRGVTPSQKWENPVPTPNTSWASSSNIVTSSSFLVDASTAKIPSPASSLYETASLSDSEEDTVPEANMLQQSAPPSPTEQAGLIYRPGDLHPITMALPKQIKDQEISHLTAYPSTSNMNPLPLDSLALPDESTKSMEPEHTLDQAVPATNAENLTPTAERNSSIAMPLENTSIVADADKPSVQLPDFIGNPVLENVMRQAQLGLFITPGHEKG